jgi:4-amino-4-deoxychorismate lyase
MILVNGIVSDSISPLDRGLMYGDGVFRTLPVRDGAPICWPQHFVKLGADCAALKIACPSWDVLDGELKALAAQDRDCAVKIVVTRGQGARGYVVPPAQHASRILMSSPLPQYTDSLAESGVRVHLCSLRLSHQPLLAGVKHLNRLESVLARMEWDDAEIAEGLLRDGDGNVVEGTMSNLFASQGDTLYTPELSRCGVAGVQRQRIMALAPRLGLRVSEQCLSLDFLLQAEEVLLCNSLIGVWPVKALAGKTWARHDLAHKIRHMLYAEND